MQVEISGNRCVGCYKYSQYYSLKYDGQFVAIDCGFCGVRQCQTRPGNRCKHYRERSNVGLPLGIKQSNQGIKRKEA